MRCKQCEYPLWNIHERRCPECGLEFRPSEYRFRRNSVRFRCPHCAQEYYGTSEHGLLEPEAFDCVRCGEHIHINEMVLEPAEGVAETATSGDINPWLARKRQTFGGFSAFGAWIKTVGMALGAPGRLMDATPAQTSTWAAVGFGVRTIVTVLIVGLAPFFVVFGLASVIGGGAAGLFGLGGAVLGGAMMLAIVIAGWLVSSLLWALLAHAVLAMTGKTAYGLDRTMQAMFFSSGVSAIQAVPCLGLYLGFVSGPWWVVSFAIALTRAQTVSAGRAVLAALAPPLLALVLAFGIVVALGGLAAFTQPGGFTAALLNPGYTGAPRNVGGVITWSDEVDQMVNSVGWAEQDLGRPARHAAELYLVGSDSAIEYTLAMSDTTDLEIRLGPTLTPYDFMLMPPDKEQAALDAIIENMPEDAIASRLGDVVLVHDVPPNGLVNGVRRDGLWRIIICPDPEAHPQAASRGGYIAVDWAGNKLTVTPRDTGTLQAQNQLRREAGLPPLPSPYAVTRGAATTAKPTGKAP